MQLIDRNCYEQLDQVMWDTTKTQLEPEEAFQLYERRWAYVDEQRLTPQEQALIAELTRTVGKGCFLPTNV
jgi:hypothetical protein